MTKLWLTKGVLQQHFRPRLGLFFGLISTETAHYFEFLVRRLAYEMSPIVLHHGLRKVFRKRSVTAPSSTMLIAIPQEVVCQAFTTDRQPLLDEHHWRQERKVTLRILPRSVCGRCRRDGQAGVETPPT